MEVRAADAVLVLGVDHRLSAVGATHQNVGVELARGGRVGGRRVVGRVRDHVLRRRVEAGLAEACRDRPFEERRDVDEERGADSVASVAQAGSRQDEPRQSDCGRKGEFIAR